MTSTIRILLTGLACLRLFTATTASAYAQTVGSQTLVMKQTTEHEIQGGESHFYKIQIGANQTARVEIEQKGIDVSLRAYKPDSQIFIETESPSGVLGSDLILVTAQENGEYKIEVAPANPKAILGKYTIRLAEIRPTISQDNEINAAAMKILKVAEETDVLRAKGTSEGRRQALEKFQEIIALSKIKQDEIWEIVAVISSGYIFNQLGEIQKSLDFYLRGLQLSRKVGNREDEGTALNNLGNSYKTLGDYEQSIFYLDQALNIYREVGDKDGEATALNNLGGCYLLLSNPSKAEELFRQALALRREIKDQRGEGNTLNNLGQVFAQSGDRTKAIDFLQQALSLRQSINDRAGAAITLLNLGKNFRDARDESKAFEYFEQSNTLGRQLGDRRVEADSFYWLAVAEREKGNLPKAIEDVENGLRIIEQIRGELINPDLRTAYFSTVQQFYELDADLLVARYEKSKNEADAALALEASEHARTRGLVELLQEANVNIRQGVNVKLLEQEQDLQNSLNQKYRQRTQLLSRKSSVEQINAITNEINSLTIDLENLRVNIRRENPRYADLTQGATRAAKEIQNLLDEETVLLEYKLGDPRSFLWLVTKDRIRIFRLPARREIEKLAKDFYSAVVSHDKRNEAQTAKLQTRLSEMLLAPVASGIPNKRLAIVADGVLQLIPFASLSSPKPGLKGQKFLAEENEIVVLPSASVLAELRHDSSRRKTPEKMIAIFADAVFDANDARLSSVSKATKQDDRPAEISKVLRDFNAGENLPRLLSSRVEAKSISALAPKNQAILDLDFDASRENATSETLSNYHILHFATHGLIDTTRPELSGLVFSLYDKRGIARDGFLRLKQIYNLNLNSDLVVLSACQTALGKDVRGEGLIGLTRGFMYAGAKRVVASLWKVDDTATAEFMRRFYQNLLQRKLMPASSLRQAQIEMKQIPRFRSPYFWAGFTIQGDWR